jgi:hypothetical protein
MWKGIAPFLPPMRTLHYVLTHKRQVACWLLFRSTDNNNYSTLGGGMLAA